MERKLDPYELARRHLADGLREELDRQGVEIVHVAPAVEGLYPNEPVYTVVAVRCLGVLRWLWIPEMDPDETYGEFTDRSLALARKVLELPPQS